MNQLDGTVLIVDDDAQIRGLLEEWLLEDGLKTLTAKDGEQALRMLADGSPDIMLLDIAMPRMDGFEVLARVREGAIDLPVVVISGLKDTPDAVRAMKAGASDFLTKPFRRPDVFRAVSRAFSECSLRRQVKDLSARLGTGSLRESMGPSDAVQSLIEEVRRVAGTDYTVLITGETGTGKEMVARALHGLSERSEKEFVPVDCGAIPEGLFESEFFGHEKGSFTGADQQRLGKFELAAEGTLFLDEITNMPLGGQAKLLRALQERTIWRVGSTTPHHVDVRIIAASNLSIEGAVAAGTFRQDLFYRFNVFPISIPPLRERGMDIIYQAKRFLDATNRDLGKNVEGFDPGALEALVNAPWPGNVRELKSVIQRAVLLASRLVGVEHLGLGSGGPVSPMSPESPAAPEHLSLRDIVKRAVESVERQALSAALEKAGGNKAEAARQLQIDYKTIHLKLNKYGMK